MPEYLLPLCTLQTYFCKFLDLIINKTEIFGNETFLILITCRSVSSAWWCLQTSWIQPAFSWFLDNTREEKCVCIDGWWTLVVLSGFGLAAICHQWNWAAHSPFVVCLKTADRSCTGCFLVSKLNAEIWWIITNLDPPVQLTRDSTGLSSVLWRKNVCVVDPDNAKHVAVASALPRPEQFQVKDRTEVQYQRRTPTS